MNKPNPQCPWGSLMLVHLEPPKREEISGAGVQTSIRKIMAKVLPHGM